MASRLVLGFGPVARRVLDRWERDELLVLDPDEARVDGLRAEGVPAERVDVTDAAALSAYDPTVAFVADEDLETSRSIAAAAREAFPAARIVAYAADGRADGVLAEHADEVLDPGTALLDRLRDVIGSGSGLRTRRLRTTLQAVRGPLAVVTHDNPDPDAIGSAVALSRIAESVGVEAVPCYFGDISHQENRAMVNLLELELRELEPEDPLDEFGGFALVDHSRPGVNDQLPPDTPVDVVIDHHPPYAPVEGRFVDLRHDVGATSTLLVEYLVGLGMEFDEQVSSALLYGIRVDTDDFARDISTEDFEAAARLLPHADLDALTRIENPSMSGETLDVLGRAIDRRRVRGEVLVSYVGSIGDRDALAQAADLLLGMNDVTTTMVSGEIDDVVFVSARARGADFDLGETLRLAFDQIGSAGGHAYMAGAQIPLGTIVELPADEHEDVGEITESVITERFFETIESRPTPLSGRSAPDEVDLGVLPGESTDPLFTGIDDRGDER